MGSVTLREIELTLYPAKKKMLGDTHGVINFFWLIHNGYCYPLSPLFPFLMDV